MIGIFTLNIKRGLIFMDEFQLKIKNIVITIFYCSFVAFLLIIACFMMSFIDIETAIFALLIVCNCAVLIMVIIMVWNYSNR